MIIKLSFGLKCEYTGKHCDKRINQSLPSLFPPPMLFSKVVFENIVCLLSRKRNNGTQLSSRFCKKYTEMDHDKQ